MAVFQNGTSFGTGFFSLHKNVIEIHGRGYQIRSGWVNEKSLIQAIMARLFYSYRRLSTGSEWATFRIFTPTVRRAIKTAVKLETMNIHRAILIL